MKFAVRVVVAVLAIAAVLPVVALSACSSSAPDANADTTWVGTITTEGNVTTVVNESGSVWGGTATLVEEASIGVAVGAEEYMLGEIASLYATDDEIYLLDQSVSQIRVYDFDGNHLRNFGRAGQGPGELGRFTGPSSMLVAGDGRVYVGDRSNRRITIYDQNGEAAGNFPFPRGWGTGRVPMVFADDGGIWWTVRLPGEDGSPARRGVQVLSAEGPVGDPLFLPEIEYEQLFLLVEGRDIDEVPFAPRLAWTYSYDQALIVGVSDRYAFRMIRPSGEITLVERHTEPVPVTPEEAEYWRRMTVAMFPLGVEISWNGENIPDHKPPFMQFFPSASGDLWVLRQGGGGLVTCDVEPEEAVASFFDHDLNDCLFPNLFFDVFDRDGRYLGSVDGAQLTLTPPFISGGMVIAVVEDEAGTITVKRYRLVLPGEDGR